MHQHTLLAFAMKQRLAFASAVVVLAACSSGGGRGAQNGVLPANLSATQAATAERGVRLVFHVLEPAHPDYVSTATKAIEVAITGPVDVKQEAALTVGAAGCQSSLTNFACDLVIPGLKPCPSKANCYKATVATYDRFNIATGKIPKDAHELSADENFPFSIGTGDATISLVLEGLPKLIAFLPTPGTNLTGSQKAGFVEPKCSASAQTVNVVGVDADGNYILGVGAPAVSLSSSDSAQLAVTRVPGSPNAFTLKPPRSPHYPFGNLRIPLAATATPGKSSGGKAVSTAIDVSYSGDICGTFTEFTVPTAASKPSGVALGPDGNVWFTEEAGSKIARITTGGDITEFTIPTAGATPIGITAGPQGELWFTEAASDKVAAATTAGVITEFTVPTAAAAPFGIAEGPDGNLWFTELCGKKIGKMTPAGIATDFATPGGTDPVTITSGPNGNLWFTDLSGDVSQVTTAGSFSFVDNVTSGLTTGIITGPNAVLWFAESATNAIGEIQANGDFVSGAAEWNLPEPESEPEFLTVGPDGAVWFTETFGNRIARITLGGQITEFAVPTSASEPAEITRGSDGALWFAEECGDKIGRLY